MTKQLTQHKAPNYKLAYKLNGGIPIIGNVKCYGAKNSATKAMVAALLGQGVTRLYNIPNIGDVRITEQMLTSAGVKLKWLNDNTIEIDHAMISSSMVSLPDSGSNRIPILLLSILLQKFGSATVPLVGGDGIGHRNLDFHINALKEFGAIVEKFSDKYTAKIEKPLAGCHIKLPYPSVGATETCLFLSVLAHGTSVIQNIALEPEIMDLITMLRSMGALIFVEPDRKLVVHGVSKLHSTDMHIVGDRIEAASWAVLACASGGRIRVHGVNPNLLGNFMSYYTMAGGAYKLIDYDIIEFYRDGPLNHIMIETDVYPGFSTDLQQPFGALLTQAHGISTIHETVHNQRFSYLDVLSRFGAKTQVINGCVGSIACRYKGRDHPHSALIQGPTQLNAIKEAIAVPDLRAGLAYLVAAALAKGITTLVGAEQIERGYGNLIDKLANTNLQIERIQL